MSSARQKQKQRVLDALKDPRGVSPWFAWEKLGNTRLAATIHSLKKEGHNITSVTEKSKNKFGETVRYSRYFLHPPVTN